MEKRGSAKRWSSWWASCPSHRMPTRLYWLGKCDILHLLKKFYSEIAICKPVYQEVVIRRLQKGWEDAQVTREAIEEAWIRVYKTSRQFTDQVGGVETRFGIQLGRGEREAIALAMEKEISILLTNDEDAYQVAEILGLEPKGILYLLLRSARKGHLNKKQAKESLTQMLEKGLWLSPKIIHNLHEALDTL